MNYIFFNYIIYEINKSPTNDNKYIIIIIILIIYLFFIRKVEGFQLNERYDFKLSRLENLMEKFIKKLLVSEKDCRGRFTKYYNVIKNVVLIVFRLENMKY